MVSLLLRASVTPQGMQAEGDEFGHWMQEGRPVHGQPQSHSDTPDMPGMVSRTNSFPGTQEMSVEGQALSPSDKKRNKLGYHRTAVACGSYMPSRTVSKH